MDCAAVMTFLKRTLVLLWLVSGSAAANTLLILGDSLSAGYGINPDKGWVALVRQQLQPLGWQVINASVSGDTSAGGLTRLPSLLQRHQPQIVLIELGGNDGLRGLPPQSLQQNLSRMAELSQHAGARPLLLGMRLPPNYGPVYTQAFAQSYQDVSNTLNIPLLPFFLEDVALHPELMQADNIHPNEQGQPLMAERVWQWLQPLLKTTSGQ
ncbi:arylesterase [Pokkaliibacter sp. MBI-7]|uniref:arylesterase n=1 Tax=Pokkaliibacter sp. MBI-7 TaxID=3040600 RepID=UPI002448D7BD|nr:arylesterase [Pokkaliibacter sp. MBI-7]MDH2432283.1 arylesterase [Pokkaliibacter sp. MBI-7]